MICIRESRASQSLLITWPIWAQSIRTISNFGRLSKCISSAKKSPFQNRISLIDLKLNLKEYKALVFAGIAKMDPLIEYMNAEVKETIIHDFTDHHSYTVADVVAISNSFKSITLAKKIIVTTEKDAMRLIEERFSVLIEELPMFYIPIEVGIHQENNQFDSLILDYVKRDKKSTTIHL